LQDAAWLRVTRPVAVEQRRVGLSVNVRHLAIDPCEEEELIVRFVVADDRFINQSRGTLTRDFGLNVAVRYEASPRIKHDDNFKFSGAARAALGSAKEKPLARFARALNTGNCDAVH
jgi:hypothetical protein